MSPMRIQPTAEPSRPAPRRWKPQPTCPMAIAAPQCATLGAISGRSRRMAGVAPRQSRATVETQGIAGSVSRRHRLHSKALVPRPGAVAAFVCAAWRHLKHRQRAGNRAHRDRGARDLPGGEGVESKERAWFYRWHIQAVDWSIARGGNDHNPDDGRRHVRLPIQYVRIEGLRDIEVRDAGSATWNARSQDWNCKGPRQVS